MLPKIHRLDNKNRDTNIKMIIKELINCTTHETDAIILKYNWNYVRAPINNYPIVTSTLSQRQL